MDAHPDLLNENEFDRGPLARSIAFHLGIAAMMAAYAWVGVGRVEHWGDPKSLGGGAVGITPVNKIPLPSREGRVNRVANDTESQIPAAPKPQPKQPQPPPDAIAIRSKNAPKQTAQSPASPQRYTPVPNPKPNQVYSSTGQALTSPMFSQAPGGGGVGSGSTSPFGNRFGWYEQLLRERVARNWRSQDLDNRTRNRVAVMFDISRDGTVRNVRISEPSGNFGMDQSAQRAILMSNPLPALPREFERDAATIEFWFSLQQ
ncbi:MAG: TonB C-terminal domain-containing protein [Bryobacteraceae bacterium]|nr:TonB C-terminal domain-containing protein [Bryobacteraceae bacterium]